MKTRFRSSTVTSKASRPYVCLTASLRSESSGTDHFFSCGAFVVSRTSNRNFFKGDFFRIIN